MKNKRHAQRKPKPTLMEYMNRLPEPYRQKAISYSKPTDLHKPVHQSCKGIDDALFSAFSFDSTPEGGDYWYDYYRSLKTV